MSLKVSAIGSVPEMTVRVARAAFPKDNVYMKMRDELGSIYTDEQFVDLFPRRGQPAEAPWRLALITVMQFAENLTDRQAADAVRARIDWKYALGLELDDPGFHYSVLSKFRTRLVRGSSEHLLFERMLAVLTEAELLASGGKQRTDSTHILAAIRSLNRLELVGEALRHALDALAAVVPAWLTARTPGDWYDQYGLPFSQYRLPSDKQECEAFALRIGTDGHYLLECLFNDVEHAWLRAIPAVETLRQIWVQQYYHHEGQLRWRTNKETPPARVRIVSPFDPEARQGKKRDTRWLGYKVHLTETCDQDMPKLITNVETRTAQEQDVTVTATIHEALQERDLLPSEHIADTGYVSGAHLAQSQDDYGIDLIGPVLPDTSWQALTEGAFDISQFHIDWDNQTATCPQGQTTHAWRKGTDRHNNALIQIRFNSKQCAVCPARAHCTRSTIGGRTLTLRGHQEHIAIQNARKREQTQAFKDEYATRAGVEGVISQAAYVLGMRRARYRGFEKTHLQHLVTATAINLKRAVSWLMGVPCATTRTTRFATLRMAPT